MKLINPTNDELEYAFTVHVAKAQTHVEVVNAFIARKLTGDGRIRIRYNWLQCLDSVLPYLNKWPEFRLYCGEYCTPHCVIVTPGGDFFEEVSDTLTMAAVVTLLRAHGVECLFSK